MWQENLHLEMHNVTFRTQILKEHHIQLDHGFYTDAEYLMLPTPIYSNSGISERDHLYVSGISVYAEYEYQEPSAE